MRDNEIHFTEVPPFCYSRGDSVAAAYNNISLGLFLINQVAILLFSRNGKKDRKERTSLLLEVRKEEGGK